MIKAPTWSCCAALGNMLMMTTSAAAAAQLGTTLPAIFWTTHTSVSHWPLCLKAGRREKQSPQAEQRLWSVLQKLGQFGYVFLWLKLTFFHMLIQLTKIVSKRFFTTNLWIRFCFKRWISSIYVMKQHSSHHHTTIQRCGEKGEMIYPSCAVLLLSSGGQSCQIVVNRWQWGRLFVWILFGSSSQACGLSLGVDMFLNGGSCKWQSAVTRAKRSKSGGHTHCQGPSDLCFGATKYIFKFHRNCWDIVIWVVADIQYSWPLGQKWWSLSWVYTDTQTRMYTHTQ